MIKAHFESIDALRTHILAMKESGKSPLYFRGQRHAWPMIASMFRSDTTDEHVERTKDFISWITRNEYLILSDDDKKNRFLPYFAIAQHYGFRTYFIDFTTDLDVACFFATDNADPEDTGAFWAIDDAELDVMKAWIRSNISNGNIDSEHAKLFEVNDYSPFFEFQLESLSRVHNQKGVFMYDYQRVMEAYFMGIPDYTFHQGGIDYAGRAYKKSYIYPKPNALEREIERFEYTYLTAENSKTIQGWVDAGVVTEIRRDYKYSDFDGLIPENEWDDEEWRKMSSDYYPNIKVNQKIIFDISSEQLSEFCKSIETTTIFVNDFLANLKSELYPDLKPADNSISLEVKLVEDILYSMAVLPYSASDTAITVCEAIRLLYSIKDQQAMKAFNQSDLNAIENAVESLWGQSAYIELEDTEGVHSKVYVPHERLDRMDKDYKYEHLRQFYSWQCDLTLPDCASFKEFYELSKTLHPDLHLDLPWRALLQFLYNPRKLFDWDDIRDIFIHYILPYQFVFREKSGRIYTPERLLRFNLA